MIWKFECKVLEYSFSHHHDYHHHHYHHHHHPTATSPHAIIILHSHHPAWTETDLNSSSPREFTSDPAAESFPGWLWKRSKEWNMDSH